MAEATPTRRNKRNALSRGEDGLELPLNKRMQSPVVFTGPDGKTLTRNRNGENLEIWPGRTKFGSAKAKQQILLRQGELAMDSCNNSSSKKPSCMRQPSFSTPQPEKVRSVHFQTPISSFPGDSHQPVSRTPVGSVEYAGTPLPSNKARPPLSGRKMKIKAAAKLQILDDHEMQASRLVQARLDFSMGRQERAYVAWLNHVLDKPAAGGCRKFTLEESVSKNSSMDALNTTGGGGDFRLIDEVYWDEDCENASPRDHFSVGKSPRSALKPLNGLANRNICSPAAKRPLKDTFLGTPEKLVLARTESPATPYLSSKRLKMITEHGFSYSRDLHMQDVCRLSDLVRRLKIHFSQNEREEILTIITQLAKHIDEGRLKMKKGCAILVDVALRRKALYVLLNYSAHWLKIGLHVVVGHTALLKETLHEDGRGDGQKELRTEEYALLEVFLEKHFFAHPGLSKAYATNKAIDGLYRDGYTEALGRVILKRFFLLVLVLDKAKCQTSLKISDGIDGLDGGSPPLFRPDARVKSSRQLLQEFLSDVMHGEGDVIGNLGSLGYHVHHHQVPLADYDFAVVDLIEDLQDGVRLCRLVQLLAASDTFILEHIQVPSNGRKRQLHNCQIALESLAQAGVPLEDEEGCSISAEDIVVGNRDKVFPLLWNIMVHLQIPLLVSRPRLCQEIAKLQGTEGGFALGLNIGTVELLLKWTQVACMISGNLNIRNFKTSFADGQALCYIVNLYLPLFLPQSDVLRPHSHINVQIDSTPNLRGPFSPAYKKAVAHNFGLVQAVARKLGNVPEVLQLVDLLGDPGMSEKNIIIFVAFLCSRLLEDEPLGIQVQERRESSHWEALDSHPVSADRAPALCSYLSRCSLESESPVGFDRSYTVSWPKESRRNDTSSPAVCSDILCDVVVNNSSEADNSETSLLLLCKLQAWWRGQRARTQFLRKKKAVKTIQQGWRSFSQRVRLDSVTKIQAHWRGYMLRQMFLRWKEAALIHRECQEREQAASIIQGYYRAWVQKRKYLETVSTMCKIQALWWANEARGNFLTQWKAVRTIESAWLDYLARKRLHYAPYILSNRHQYAVRQSLIRLSTASSLSQSWFLNHIGQYDDEEAYKMMNVQGWLQDSELQSTEYYVAVIQATWKARVARKRFLKQKHAAFLIQRQWRKFLDRKSHKASILIQAKWRSFKCHQSFMDMKRSAVTIQSFFRGTLVRREYEGEKQNVIRLQAWCRGLAQRRRYQSAVRKIITIQTYWRAWRVRKAFIQLKGAVLKVQARRRGFQSRKQLRKCREAVSLLLNWYRSVLHRKAFMRFRTAVVIIQTVWRSHIQRRDFLEKRSSAVLIQRRYRAFIQRKKEMFVSHVCKIQAAWRGLQTRRHYVEQRRAAAVIQAQFRAYIVGHEIHSQFLKEKSAVLCIERCYMAFADRRNVMKFNYASKIQNTWRRFYARREFLTKRKAAVVIQECFLWYLRRTAQYQTKICKVQAHWRGFRERRRFLRQRRAVKLIQAHYRAFVQRKVEHLKHSICKIQATWRCRKSRSQFTLFKRAAVQIQARYRCYKARQEFLELKRAASLIQASYRSFSQLRFRPIVEPTFCCTVRRICMIQAVWRSIMARRRVNAQRIAVQTIQIAWRQYSKKCQDSRRKGAAVQIQAWYRGNLQRRKFNTAREAVLAIQVHVKGWIQRRRYRKTVESLCKVQALFRAKKARVQYTRRKEAVCMIQGAWRGKVCRRKFLQLRGASIIIQAHFRGFVQRNRVQHHIEVKRAANQTAMNGAIQPLSSKAEAKEESLSLADHEVLQSVLKLQAIFRLSSARRKKVQTQSPQVLNQTGEYLSAENPQKLARDRSVIHCFQSDVCDSTVGVHQYEHCEKMYAAMVIQGCWKGYSVRKGIAVYTNMQHGSNEKQVAQCGVETSLGLKKFTSQELSAGFTLLRWLVFWRNRSFFLKLRKAAPLIQRHVRGWLCRRRFTLTRNRIVFLQAHWRGVLLRKDTNQVNLELRQLRQRIQCTAAGVQDSDRLGNRLTEALALLLSQKTVTGILSICRTIDVATQHSKKCCDRLAEAGAVTKILNLIQTINRSPPHEQVLKHALAILNNLSHHMHMRILIVESPGAISIISEILHMFRNKDEIFSKAIELLKPVCELSTGMELLQREPSIVRRLQLVAQSLDRKVHAEKRNQERLSPTTASLQRKAAEKRVTEASHQFSILMSLLREISKLEHSQRRKTTPISVHPPSASKRTPPNHRRPSLATRPSNLGPRVPLQDRTNW